VLVGSRACDLIIIFIQNIWEDSKLKFEAEGERKTRTSSSGYAEMLLRLYKICRTCLDGRELEVGGRLGRSSTPCTQMGGIPRPSSSEAGQVKEQ